MSCTIVTALVFVGLASGQVLHHLNQLQQPHLPRDANVLAAAQQFLQQFSNVQSKAAASAPAQQQLASPHQRVSFVHQPPPPPTTTTTPAHPPPPARNPFLPEEPINAAIRHLHQTLKRPASNQGKSINNGQQPFQQQPAVFHPQQNPQTFQAPQQNQQTFQTPQQQQQSLHPQQHQTQNHHQAVGHVPVIPIVNQFGHVINPNKFPGPLADELPAAVNGPLQSVGPTLAVHEAQQQLAQAHMAVLAHHATLPTQAPEQGEGKKQ